VTFEIEAEARRKTDRQLWLELNEIGLQDPDAGRDHDVVRLVHLVVLRLHGDAAAGVGDLSHHLAELQARVDDVVGLVGPKVLASEVVDDGLIAVLVDDEVDIVSEVLEGGYQSHTLQVWKLV
jgi:hypothetical protein